MHQDDCKGRLCPGDENDVRLELSLPFSAAVDGLARVDAWRPVRPVVFGAGRTAGDDRPWRAGKGEPRETPAGDVVLVVEGDAAVRWIVTRALSGSGLAVKLAGNGAAALAALAMIEAVGDSPRALYIDLALPDMPGEAVIASARARWPELPVVVASGAWDAHECARAAAATLFLEKPIQIEELIATLYAVVAG